MGAYKQGEDYGNFAYNPVEGTYNHTGLGLIVSGFLRFRIQGARVP